MTAAFSFTDLGRLMHNYRSSLRSERSVICLLSFAAILLSFCSLRAAQPAEHVVLVVWDGMRPDFISPRYTPTLWDLANSGVRFDAHHSVYPTSTEVNGAALATGCNPEHSGIIGNKMYLPQINIHEAVATEALDTIRRGDALTGGHFVRRPTFEEILHQAGITTAIAGAKPVAILHDRSSQRESVAAQNSPVLYGGRTLPSRWLKEVVNRLGREFPSSAIPNVGRDEWTTRALIESFWRQGVPRFSLLWLSEPDASQHIASPGSKSAISALASGDRNLAAVLRALEAKGVRQKTDVLVVSDHAFSTVERGVDLSSVLKKAGFDAHRRLEDPEPGQVLITGLGGTAMFSVIGHDEATVGRLVKFLQGSDFAGVIFSRVPLPGTFTLKDGRIESGSDEPDVVLAMKWTSRKNEFGAPGQLVGDNLKPGTGSHTSLSRFDVHNTLVAAGPRFKRGYDDKLPSANRDVAPTILSLLGIEIPADMDGRVLAEALAGQSAPPDPVDTKVLETKTRLNGKTWRQYLKISSYQGHAYLDEGNGEVEGFGPPIEWPVSPR